MSMYKSDTQRRTISLNTVLEVSTLAARALDSRSAWRAARIRRRSKRQTSDALDLVQAHILEQHSAAALQVRGRYAASRAYLAAHFEQIGEIRREPERQSHVQRAVAEIAHEQALVAGALPDELEPVQVDLLAAERDPPVDEQIGVAEIGTEHRVVVLSHRTQQ